MPHYIIISRFSPNAFDRPEQIKDLAQKVKKSIAEECPDVTWKDSYVTLGDVDVVDVVESKSEEQVARAALLIRSHGNCSTETFPATPWKAFLESL